MSGPYGDFHPIFDSKREMMWIGGGAGMAPLRAQIMHMTKTLKTTDRKMSYFYGARALNEVFYLEDFLEIEKEFPNFTFTWRLTVLILPLMLRVLNIRLDSFIK